MLNLKKVDIRDIGFAIGTLKEGENVEKLLTVVKYILKELQVGYVDECCGETNPASPDTQVMTYLSAVTLTGNELSITYIGENGVPQIKKLDLSVLVPNLQIETGEYIDATNTLKLVTADGTVIEVVINELTGFTNVLASGHLIGTFTDENEETTDIFETITAYTTFITP